MKRREKKGFTLAELLVVVAIIGVLVAVAIPVFNSSLEKAKLAADHAAVRDIYAVIQIANNTKEVTYMDENGKMVTKTFEDLDVLGKTQPTFYGSEDGSYLIINGLEATIDKAYEFKANGAVGTEPCPVCKQWDDDTKNSIPLSKLHTVNSRICVFYSEGALRLGMQP